MGLGNLHSAFARVMLRALRAGGRDGAPLAGCAWMHMDFALAPSRFTARAFGPFLGDFWTARGGLFPMFRDPCCFSTAAPHARARRPSGCAMRGSNYPGTWGWYADARQRCLAAAATLGAADCCYGWSDFLYVPARALPALAALLGGTELRGVFHEVAVPTAVNLLVRRGGHGRWRLLPRCQGSAMTPRLNRPQLGQIRYCAHRMDLKDARYREALRQLLDARPESRPADRA